MTIAARQHPSTRSIPVTLLPVVACALLAVLSPTLAQAQGGATLTPDRQTYLVNKDVGSERWTIAVNLVAPDSPTIASVTGNVFQEDGQPPSFLLCQIGPSSTGSLANPQSTFRLTCKGSAACTTTARDCAREDDWTLINSDVPVQSSFFLPPGGQGGAQTAARTASVSAPDRVSTFIAEVVSRLSSLALSGRRLALGPNRAEAQANDRGATLSLDRLNFLVSKDVGNERWSISLNRTPVISENGGVVDRIVSVSGNVYRTAGAPPSFVYCTVRPDSTGTLDDLSSQFRLSCQGMDACQTSALECATANWAPITDDLAVPASFFLPPGGLPRSEQSDPAIFVIGRPSDPPSIVTKDFTTDAARVSGDRVAGAEECATGSPCTANRIGSCEAVPGTLFAVEGFGCGCRIDDVPASCIGCGGGATGSCGGDCDYQVGDSTARGVCLPFASSSDACSCFAVGAGQSQDVVVEGCGGVLGADCGGDRCCADDPRDGCNSASGNVTCPGICVGANGCDPSRQTCGICGSEEPNRPRCGDGIRNGSDACDGSDLGDATCEDLGLSSTGPDGAREPACGSSCSLTPGNCACPGPCNSPETLEAAEEECRASCDGVASIMANCEGACDFSCDCSPTARCGNGVVEPGEDCEPPSTLLEVTPIPPEDCTLDPTTQSFAATATCCSSSCRAIELGCCATSNSGGDAICPGLFEGTCARR